MNRILKKTVSGYWTKMGNKVIEYEQGYIFPGTWLKYNRDLGRRNVGKKGQTKRLVECLCFYENCDNLHIVVLDSVLRKLTVSCGCYNSAQASRLMIKDITGQRFGRWIAIRSVGQDLHGNYLWECVCDCGEVRAVITASLIKGNSKSCGCFDREQISKRSIKDLTGKRFSLLLVIRQAGRTKGQQVLWLCRCDCDRETVVQGNCLTRGSTRSCGHGRRLTQFMIFDKIVKPICPDAVSEYALTNRQKLDIAIESLKIAIEYDGHQHSEITWYDKGDPSKLAKRKAADRKKNKELKRLGWKLLRIPERKYVKNPDKWNKKIEKFIIANLPQSLG